MPVRSGVLRLGFMRTAETDSQNAEGALLCEANPTVMLEENRVSKTNESERELK